MCFQMSDWCEAHGSKVCSQRETGNVTGSLREQNLNCDFGSDVKLLRCFFGAPVLFVRWSMVGVDEKIEIWMMDDFTEVLSLAPLTLPSKVT